MFEYVLCARGSATRMCEWVCYTHVYFILYFNLLYFIQFYFILFYFILFYFTLVHFILSFLLFCWVMAYSQKGNGFNYMCLNSSHFCHFFNDPCWGKTYNFLSPLFSNFDLNNAAKRNMSSAVCASSIYKLLNGLHLLRKTTTTIYM